VGQLKGIMEKKILFYENGMVRDELPSQGLLDFAQKLDTPLEFDFHLDQYWLKSNRPKEKPIGIDVAAELNFNAFHGVSGRDGGKKPCDCLFN